MSDSNSAKDYYGILGADSTASRQEIERLYKRKAAQHHPDRGGSEEQMKSLNEAYGVLKNESTRRVYDSNRLEEVDRHVIPVVGPTAQDVGVFGHCLSALLCLLVGLFLLFLVRFQWIWFLWPLAILAGFVIAFGVLMARSAMVAVHDALPFSHVLKRHSTLREIIFWLVVGSFGYAVYLVLTAVE